MYKQRKRCFAKEFICCDQKFISNDLMQFTLSNDWFNATYPCGVPQRMLKIPASDKKMQTRPFAFQDDELPKNCVVPNTYFDVTTRSLSKGLIQIIFWFQYQCTFWEIWNFAKHEYIVSRMFPIWWINPLSKEFFLFKHKFEL